MITASDEEIAACIGELPFFNILHPGAINPDWDIVFGFTRDGTGMAADTLTLVDDKGVFRHACFPLVRQYERPTSRLFGLIEEHFPP